MTDKPAVVSPFASQSPKTDQLSPTRSVAEQVVSGLSSVATVAHLVRLSAAAQTLNVLSDQLTKEVTDIEAAVNKLNLGIWAYVDAVILNSSDDRMYSHGLQLVYGKSGGKWGFLIDEYSEDANCPDQGDRESWPFKDAPREFRLKVVDKIPALLEALVKRSAEVASDITKKVKFAQELATAITLNSPSGSTKKEPK